MRFCCNWGILYPTQPNQQKGDCNYGLCDTDQGELRGGGPARGQARAGGLLGRLVLPLHGPGPYGGRDRRRGRGLQGGQGQRGRPAGAGAEVPRDEHPYADGLQGR